MNTFVLVDVPGGDQVIVRLPAGRDESKFRDMIEDEIGLITRGVIQQVTVQDLRNIAARPVPPPKLTLAGMQRDYVWVRRIDDDADVPVTGLVVDVDAGDEEYVMVVWGEAADDYHPFDPVPDGAVRVAMDELTPVRRSQPEA